MDKHLFLAHYGVGALNNPPGRGSGRYPRGSGKDPRADKREHADDIRVSKGTKLQTISVGNPKKLNGFIYSSYLPQDKYHYGSHYAEYLKQEFYVAQAKKNLKFGKGYHPEIKKAKLFNNEFDLSEDLLSPSLDKRKQFFYDLYKRYPNEMAKYLATSKISRSSLLSVLNRGPIDITSKETQKYLDTGKEAMAKQYWSFARYLGDKYQDSENWGRSAYFDKLKQHGYNAIVDDMDYLAKYAYSPIIVLDSDKSIANATVKDMTGKDIRQNYKKLRDWKKDERKRKKELE